MINASENSKSQTVALLLAIFLGGLGIHRFYLGHVLTGVLRIVCLPLILIPFVGPLLVFGWHLIDIILVASKGLRPADGSPYA